MDNFKSKKDLSWKLWIHFNYFFCNFAQWNVTSGRQNCIEKKLEVDWLFCAPKWSIPITVDPLKDFLYIFSNERNQQVYENCIIDFGKILVHPKCGIFGPKMKCPCKKMSKYLLGDTKQSRSSSKTASFTFKKAKKHFRSNIC